MGTSATAEDLHEHLVEGYRACPHPAGYVTSTALVDLPTMRSAGVAVSCGRCSLIVHVPAAAA